MKNIVSKYLSSKEKHSYTQLDLLFEMYLNEMMDHELTNLDFYDIEIFTYCNKGLENSIQVNFKYYNLVCTIDFFNYRYEYTIYAIDDKFDQIKDSFTECEYEKDFSFKSLINFIYRQLKVNSKLKKDTQLMIMKKMYKTISNICLIVPSVIIGGLAIYILVSKETITLDPFFILIIVIPIILWIVFYVKSAKIK